eukprot:GHVR01119924.1.p3 GENE.GHVR01119924.1~~GHVR01119924.1.p3  ORF type:complete len:137 (+),score=11.74 GHVR01119924.1:1713-2123(+)
MVTTDMASDRIDPRGNSVSMQYRTLLISGLRKGISSAIANIFSCLMDVLNFISDISMEKDDETKEQIMCMVGSRQFDYGSATIRDVKMDIKSGISSPFPSISGRISIHDGEITCLLTEDPVKEGSSCKEIDPNMIP